MFFKLFTLLAKYLLRSDLRAVDIILISPVLFHVSMVEGVLTELNEVLEPISSLRGIIQVKSHMYNRH